MLFRLPQPGQGACQELLFVIPTAPLFGASETAAMRLQAGAIAMSPSLLAAMPYLVALVVIVLSQARARRTGAMPADLTAIFRSG